MNTKQQQHRGPVHRIVRGKYEAAIWERSGKSGRFFQVSLNRSYKEPNGTYARSPNLGAGDVGDALLALAAASLWVEEQTKPRPRPNGHSGQHEAGEFDDTTHGYEGDY
jgi:hypothetical protein